ncbi:MFS transporter [Skeletonema marinoi]|uniref:MFS transporter n=1 Tax=Skeletonema marinoi TaxID=267567 RepID=A0AAD8YKU8_9STRA|nr:MFS transporter [Skeletonema marinoi]
MSCNASSKDDRTITNSSSNEDEKKENSEHHYASVKDCDDGHATSSTDNDRSLQKSPMIHPTTTLCILVMIDMLSVSIVVPLLHQYYKTSGVHSAQQRELLSSLFSSSQIVGGLIIGALSDVGILSRRNILFLSFLGSAVSYALIVVGGLRSIVFSRVLVGLVKQTMTVSTGLLTAIQPIMIEVFTWVDFKLPRQFLDCRPNTWSIALQTCWSIKPCIVASCLFLFNSMLAAVLLPRDDPWIKVQTPKSPRAEWGSIHHFSKTESLLCIQKTGISCCILATLWLGNKDHKLCQHGKLLRRKVWYRASFQRLHKVVSAMPWLCHTNLFPSISIICIRWGEKGSLCWSSCDGTGYLVRGLCIFQYICLVRLPTNCSISGND